MGLLDGVCATNRKEPDRLEASGLGSVPIDRLGFHLLRRAGHDEGFISEVARVMEYHRAHDLYRDDLETATEVVGQRWSRG